MLVTSITNTEPIWLKLGMEIDYYTDLNTKATFYSGKKHDFHGIGGNRNFFARE